MKHAINHIICIFLVLSRHFEKYINANDVVSYILNAQLKQKNHITMYYVTPSLTDDGRYMWFWQTDGRSDFSLVLIDLEKDEIRPFKNMQIAESSTPYTTMSCLPHKDYFTDAIGEYGKENGRVPVENRMWLIYNTRSFGTPELIWKNALSHASSSKSGLYLVADHGYKMWEKTDSVRMSFFDIQSGKDIDIASKMPYSGYQNHPRPHFAMNDQVICYTFSKKEKNTVAICFTDQLLKLSK